MSKGGGVRQGSSPVCQAPLDRFDTGARRRRVRRRALLDHRVGTPWSQRPHVARQHDYQARGLPSASRMDDHHSGVDGASPHDGGVRDQRAARDGHRPACRSVEATRRLGGHQGEIHEHTHCRLRGPRCTWRHQDGTSGQETRADALRQPHAGATDDSVSYTHLTLPTKRIV